MSFPLIEITVVQRLKFVAVADLFVTALEGGSNYWLDSLRVHPEGSLKDAQYLFDALGNNETIQVSYLTVDEAEDDQPPTVKHIDLTAITAAVSALVKARGLTVVDGEFGDYDADDADMFLQHLLLGELVYG